MQRTNNNTNNANDQQHHKCDEQIITLIMQTIDNTQQCNKPTI
jgi:hypothetical protein